MRVLLRGFVLVLGFRRSDRGTGGGLQSEQTGQRKKAYAEIACEAVDGDVHLCGVRGNETVDTEPEGEPEHGGCGEGRTENIKG